MFQRADTRTLDPQAVIAIEDDEDEEARIEREREERRRRQQAILQRHAQQQVLTGACGFLGWVDGVSLGGCLSFGEWRPHISTCPR